MSRPYSFEHTQLEAKLMSRYRVSIMFYHDVRDITSIIAHGLPQVFLFWYEAKQALLEVSFSFVGLVPEPKSKLRHNITIFGKNCPPCIGVRDAIPFYRLVLRCSGGPRPVSVERAPVNGDVNFYCRS